MNVNEQDIVKLIEIFKHIDQTNLLLIPNVNSYITHFFYEVGQHTTVPDTEEKVYFSSLPTSLFDEVISEYLDDLLQCPEKLTSFAEYIKLRVAVDKWMESLGF